MQKKEQRSIKCKEESKQASYHKKQAVSDNAKEQNIKNIKETKQECKTAKTKRKQKMQKRKQ